MIHRHYFETSDEESRDFQDYRPVAWQRRKQVNCLYKTGTIGEVFYDRNSIIECLASLILKSLIYYRTIKFADDIAPRIFLNATFCIDEGRYFWDDDNEKGFPSSISTESNGTNSLPRFPNGVPF